MGDLSQFVPAAQPGGAPNTSTAAASQGSDLSQFVPSATPGGTAGGLRDFIPQREIDGTSLADEFVAGLGGGVDSLQMSLFGVAGLAGRELGIKTLEDFGMRGAESNLAEAENSGRTAGSFSEIEDAGGFFKWVAASLGEALPSLALAVSGSGIGGVLGRKVIENQVKKTLQNRVARTLRRKVGEKQGNAAAARIMRSRQGEQMIEGAVLRGKTTGQLTAEAFKRGAAFGGPAISTLPQTGQIDLELREAGIDAGLTSILGGVVGGALEGLPAARILGRMFPGVDTVVSKAFVKDFALSAGLQSTLEGATEGAQEIIQLAAMAYHDPSFDIMDPANATRVIDAFAVGALVGGVTGAGADLIGGGTRKVRKAKDTVSKATLPTFSLGIGDIDAPEGFDAAQNTVFEEVRSRIDAKLSPIIEPIINSARDGAQQAIDALDKDLAGGMNEETAKFSQLVASIHNKFVDEHKQTFAGLKDFVRAKAAAITAKVQNVQDPAAKEAAMIAEVNALREDIEAFTARLKEDVAKRDEAAKTEIDNQDFADLPLPLAEDVVTEPQGTELPSDEVSDDILLDAPEKFVLGKHEREGTLGPKGVVEVAGYDTRAQARNALDKTVRPSFPSATDSTFAIRQQEDGTFVIGLANVGQGAELLADKRTTEAVKEARQSAEKGNPDAKRHFKPEGKSRMDLMTLAIAGKKLTPETQVDSSTGLRNMATRLFERGILTGQEVETMVAQFEKNKDALELEARAPVTIFPTRGAAQAAMIEVRQKLEAAGREVDRDSLVVEERDGGFAFGFNPEGARPTKFIRDAVVEDRRGRQLSEDFVDPSEFETEEPSQDPDPEAGATPETQVKEPQPLGGDKRTADARAQTRKIMDRGGKTAVLLGDVTDPDGAIQKNVKRILNFVHKKFGMSNPVVVVDDVGMSNLIETGLVSDPVFKDTLENPAVKARIIRHYEDTVYIYLSPEVLSDPIQTTMALGHELGHLLFWTEWGNLTTDAKNFLIEAYNASGDARFFAHSTAANLSPDKIFEEWMADQLAVWIATNEEPKGVVEQFFHDVGQKVQTLYRYLKDENYRARFRLNESFNEFAQAVIERVENAEGISANPITPNALETWFTDLGSTGYKWWGPLPTSADMVVPTPRVAARTYNDITKRFEAAYPIIAKRGKAIRNWTIAAYQMAVAPSTSVIRSLGKRVPAARKLATIFSREDMGEPKLGSNYHHRKQIFKARFMSRFDEITEGMSETAQIKLIARLRELERTGEAIPDNFEFAQGIRDLFDEMHEYARHNGLPIKHIVNYFPRQFSREALVNNKERILTHLMQDMSLDNARGFYNSLISPEAQDGRASGDGIETPGFRNMNSRRAIDPWFDQFLDNDLQGIVSNYVNSVVKRAEFNRPLGEDGSAQQGKTVQQLVKEGLWDPKRKMNLILKQAHNQGATDEDLKMMQKYIDANLGQLGRDDISPGLRKWMAGVMAYQNMRVLLFTVFASLPDIVGPAIRSKSMKGAFTSMYNNMSEIGNDDSDLSKMARALGVVNSELNNHIMTEYVDNHYMPATLRKWNDSFFKWTGLNWWTDFTRKAALGVGIDYLQEQAAIVKNPPTEKDGFKAVAALKEFGLTREDVNAWVEFGKPVYGSIDHDITNETHLKVAEALVQFVDESIMRPNASQRPILASHPGVMLMFHLKGFIYATHEVVVKRIIHNIDTADTPSQKLAMMMPVVAMMALTAVGLELRELIQYMGSGRTPPTNRMTGDEYLLELFQRAGLGGLSQLAFDFEAADERGMNGLAALSGPTLNQVGDFLAKPSTQNIPKALPVIGQLPAGRSAVRSAL